MFTTFTDAENTNLLNIFYRCVPAFTSFSRGKYISKLEIKKIPSDSLRGWPLPARTKAHIPALPPWSGMWGEQLKKVCSTLSGWNAAIQRGFY